MIDMFRKIFSFFRKKKIYIDSGIDTHAITYIDPDDIIPRFMSNTERFYISQAINEWNNKQLKFWES